MCDYHSRCPSPCACYGLLSLSCPPAKHRTGRQSLNWTHIMRASFWCIKPWPRCRSEDSVTCLQSASQVSSVKGQVSTVKCAHNTVFPMPVAHVTSSCVATRILRHRIEERGLEALGLHVTREIMCHCLTLLPQCYTQILVLLRTNHIQRCNKFQPLHSYQHFYPTTLSYNRTTWL